jgi:hypothetical protein
VLAGRWQDRLPELAAAGAAFDAVYFDTYAEAYADLRGFVAAAAGLGLGRVVALYYHLSTSYRIH